MAPTSAGNANLASATRRVLRRSRVGRSRCSTDSTPNSARSVTGPVGRPAADVACAMGARGRRVASSRGDESGGETVVAVVEFPKTDGESEGDDDEGGHASGQADAGNRGLKLLGMDPSPELVAIGMVYLVQGILGLSRLAVFFPPRQRLFPLP
mmetsp:Transcript_42159/g.75675  ORF Transcript_42159/g.75675 Transcript_42159/m.75675 type:complete len:154 (-) Transcript_42159:1312-1773(-)